MDVLKSLNQAPPPNVEIVLRDFGPLSERIGSTAGMGSLTGVARAGGMERVSDRASLDAFLERFSHRVLAGFELQTIARASRHAARSEARELIQLDASLDPPEALRPFMEASRTVGCAQINRLRPLRDERLVQRYLRAVDSGAASGWHTIVYGIVLSLYSLPLRQGLFHYGHRVLTDLARSAGASAGLPNEACAMSVAPRLRDLSPQIEAVIRQEAFSPA